MIYFIICIELIICIFNLNDIYEELNYIYIKTSIKFNIISSIHSI